MIKERVGNDLKTISLITADKNISGIELKMVGLMKIHKKKDGKLLENKSFD